MIAWVNGKMVVGSPEEIAEYERLSNESNSGMYLPRDFDDWRYRNVDTGIEYLRYCPVCNK